MSTTEETPSVGEDLNPNQRLTLEEMVLEENMPNLYDDKVPAKWLGEVVMTWIRQKKPPISGELARAIYGSTHFPRMQAPEYELISAIVDEEAKNLALENRLADRMLWPSTDPISFSLLKAAEAHTFLEECITAVPKSSGRYEEPIRAYLVKHKVANSLLDREADYFRAVCPLVPTNLEEVRKAFFVAYGHPEALSDAHHLLRVKASLHLFEGWAEQKGRKWDSVAPDYYQVKRAWADAWAADPVFKDLFLKIKDPATMCAFLTLGPGQYRKVVESVDTLLAKPVITIEDLIAAEKPYIRLPLKRDLAGSTPNPKKQKGKGGKGSNKGSKGNLNLNGDKCRTCIEQGVSEAEAPVWTPEHRKAKHPKKNEKGFRGGLK